MFHHLLSFWPRLVRSGVRPSEATPNVVRGVETLAAEHGAHLTHWRQQCDRGLAPRQRGPQSKRDPLFDEVRKLKQENGHLTQRLARAEIIIDVQKKVSLLLGIPLATVDSDESKL